jgi:hypothetical protein
MLSDTFIDEFGFDKIERSECPEAAHLFYNIIAAAKPEALHGSGHERGP